MAYFSPEMMVRCLVYLIFCLGRVGVVLAQVQCGEPADAFPFYHGVASGDATSSAVILWTRVTPERPMDAIEVKWMIFSSENSEVKAAEGILHTGPDKDYTVKADATGLAPDSWYYYRFEALGHRSIMGRTKTLPAEGTADLAVGVFSCANYERGYFNAYRHAADRNDLQAVFHLGDYYYEGAGKAVLPDRHHLPAHTVYTLQDYRTRQAQVCSDPDLMALRRQLPWYVIWDDHEIADDCYTINSPGHDWAIMGWEERKHNALKAYFEWMPIRPNADGSIFRVFSAGDLVDFRFVDDRLFNRSQQVAPDSPLLDDPTRAIIGPAQMQWLTEGMAQSEKIWQVVPSSVLKSPAVTAQGLPLDVDLWEGYRAERNTLFQFVQDSGIENFVSLAGDFHASWAADLAFGNYDTLLQTGSVGCELVAPGVTSYPHTVGNIAAFQDINPHIKHIEQTSNGYLICRFSTEAVDAQWMYISTIYSREFETFLGQKVRMEAGHPFLSLENGNLQLAPNTALPATTEAEESWPAAEGPRLADALPFPNPNAGIFQVRWMGPCGTVQWQLYDLAGRWVWGGMQQNMQSGLQNLRVELPVAAAGTYILTVQAGEEHSMGLIMVHP